MTCFAKAISQFHNDESGESSSLANVFTLTIGALVMVGVYSFWDGTIQPWVQTSLSALIGIDFTS